MEKNIYYKKQIELKMFFTEIGFTYPHVGQVQVKLRYTKLVSHKQKYGEKLAMHGKLGSAAALPCPALPRHACCRHCHR